MFDKITEFSGWVVAWMVVAWLIFALSGCAVSRQNFVDQSFDEGLMVREVKGKSLTIAPPFGSKSISDHTLDMDEVDGDWLRMLLAQ